MISGPCEARWSRDRRAKRPTNIKNPTVMRFRVTLLGCNEWSELRENELTELETVPTFYKEDLKNESATSLHDWHDLTDPSI